MTDRPDATAATRRKPLPRRFYTRVAVATRDGAYVVTLDDKPTRTPARQLLAVPSERLATALAQEWEAQREHIDPTAMPLNRLVDSAIDAVAREAEAVRTEIVKYAASDLLCYRAEEPVELVRRQEVAWDPVLGWVRDAMGARFVLAEGVMFVDQPAPAIEAVRHEVGRLDPLALTALHSVTTLTGSALLALAVLHRRLGAAEAWAAAHVDEDWNREHWGIDPHAALRRASREAEMNAAALMLELLRGT